MDEQDRRNGEPVEDAAIEPEVRVGDTAPESGVQPPTGAAPESDAPQVVGSVAATTDGVQPTRSADEQPTTVMPEAPGAPSPLPQAVVGPTLTLSSRAKRYRVPAAAAAIALVVGGVAGGLIGYGVPRGVDAVNAGQFGPDSTTGYGGFGGQGQGQGGPGSGSDSGSGSGQSSDGQNSDGSGSDGTGGSQNGFGPGSGQGGPGFGQGGPGQGGSSQGGSGQSDSGQSDSGSGSGGSDSGGSGSGSGSDSSDTSSSSTGSGTSDS
jgi:hypothetical protein